MYIDSFNENSISMQGRAGDYLKKLGRKAEQKIIGAIPSYTTKDSEKINRDKNKMVSRISEPAMNRLITGIFAIILQPSLDALNSRVDDDTRDVSIKRTFSKALVGMLSGILFRGLISHNIHRFTNPESKNRLGKILLPKQYLEEIKKNPQYLSNHRNTMSTILALCLMSVTNLVVDAPLTTKLTNKMLSKKIKNKNAKEIETDNKEEVRNG